MKRSEIRKSGPIAVGFLIFIHITYTKCLIEEHNYGTTIQISNMSKLSANSLNKKSYTEGSRTIQKIVIIDNNFTTLPEDIFNSLTDVDTLEVNRNQLTTLPENIFKHLTQLEVVNFDRNQFKTLPETIFHGQANLREIHLSENNFTTLPEHIFQGLKSIEVLDLSANQLTTLSGDIFVSAENLKDLILSKNNLTTLPEYIFASTKDLKLLDLSSNQLTALPEIIFNALNNLTGLNLARNPFGTLAAKIFDGRTNLQALCLSDNQLTTIPDNIFRNLGNLSNLELSKNQLTTLPDEIFKGLTKLWHLDLAENQLKALPANIFKDQHELSSLSLNQNKLTLLSEDIFHSVLKCWDLNLAGNALTTLPENIFRNQTKLSDLNLSGNQLTTLPKNIFSSQKYLWALYLDKNPWQCDYEFLDVVQPFVAKVSVNNFDEILCADGHSIGYKSASKDISEMCPTECNCSMLNNTKTVVVNCSGNNLKSVPSGLGKTRERMSAFGEIVLNLDNNNLINLPNSTIPGYDFFTNLTAKNNSITSINVTNLPLYALEIDLSNNKLESLSTAVYKRLKYMRMLKRLVLAENPWICNEEFFDFIRFNKERVDFEDIVCNDGEFFHLKLDRLGFLITDESENVTRSEWTSANEVFRKLKHEEDLGRICPPECDCLIAQKNTTISYKCSGNSFTRILNHFYSGKRYWPSLKHRQLLFR